MKRRAPGSTTRDGYGADHRRARAQVLADGALCHRCGAPATQADHVPPLDLVALALGLDRRSAGALYSTDGSGDLRLLPCCGPCNRDAGRRYAELKRSAGIHRPAHRAPLRPVVDRSRYG